MTAVLDLGSGIRVDPPVVLAPMAGVTNVAFRQLCREQGAARRRARNEREAERDQEHGATPRRARNERDQEPSAGLYVCEMITSRALVEGDDSTQSMLAFAPGERVRSVQLYGVDPRYVGKAVSILCDEYAVDHVDLNFGCPVPKVTRRGGGAALPWKRGLMSAILRAAVAAARPYDVPVTCKTRIGIDEDHVTFLDAGRIAEDAGCAAIALHGRTAAQHYSGTADWPAIARLVSHVGIPVLGNGDIWEAGDALRMVAETGCAGVVIGRGCLGRPWLFRDLAAAFVGEPAPPLPTLGEVAAMMRRHVELLTAYLGEQRACVEFRKHVAWYLKGFAVRREVRGLLGMITSMASLDALLAELEVDQPFPRDELGTPRGRQGSPKRVVLPDGWLASTSWSFDDDLAAAELGISGG